MFYVIIICYYLVSYVTFCTSALQMYIFHADEALTIYIRGPTCVWLKGHTHP